MTIAELFVQDVMRTAGPYRHNPALAALGLCTELAEFVYAKPESQTDEAGDVLWHVVALLGRLPALVDLDAVGVPLPLKVVEHMDAVKKAIAKGLPVPLAPVLEAAAYVAEGDSFENILLFNMAKRHKRYPSASPEVVALLTERGYL